MGATVSKQLDGRGGQLQGRLIRGHNKASIHAAAKAGDERLLEQLLQPLVSAVTAEMAVPGVYPGPAAAALSQAVGHRNRNSRTPFLIACHHGSWECAELLLEAGSNILAVDADGNGCLHLASINGHGHVVDQLLAKAEVQGIAGRLVQTFNHSGFSPLHYAAWAGHAHIVRQLLMATSVSDRLLLQACTDNYDRWLMVSAGSTALHAAAQQHHAAVVLAIMQHYALLVRDGVQVSTVSRRPADPRAWPDARGATPLHVALWKGLTPDSQLAVLLHHRTDVTTLFSIEQLEGLRKRGPPTLQVLASNALRTELTRQLSVQQQQLLEAQQLEAQQAAARERQHQLQLQEQRRQRRRESKQQRERIWQRWWGQAAAGGGEPQSTPVGSTPSAAQSVSTAVGTADAAAVLSGSRRNSMGDDGAVQADETDSSPWHDLHRTPSITLGAVQQYRSATWQQDSSTGSEQLPGAAELQLFGSPAAARDVAAVTTTASSCTVPQDAVPATNRARPEIQPAAPSLTAAASANSVTVAIALLAPAALAATAAEAGAASGQQEQQRLLLHAAPDAAEADGGSGLMQGADACCEVAEQPGKQSGQLASASSITLGCLDRIWHATQEQQREQPHQQQHRSEEVVCHADSSAGDSTGKQQEAAPCYTDSTADKKHTDKAAGAGAVAKLSSDSKAVHSSRACHQSGVSSNSPAPATPDLAGAEAPHARQAACSSRSNSSNSGSSAGVGDTAAVGTAQVAVAACTCGHTLQQCCHSRVPEGAGSAERADADCTEHLYKGVGAVSSFQLLTLPHVPSKQQQQLQQHVEGCSAEAIPASLLHDTAGQVAAPAAAGGCASGTDASDTDDRAAGCSSSGSTRERRCVSAEPACVSYHTHTDHSWGQPSDLYSSSVTLAQLASRQQPQQQHHLQQQPPQQDALRCAQQVCTQELYKLPQTSSDSGAVSTGRQQSRKGSNSSRWHNNSKVHPLLATAGIKSTDWDTHLTPLAWKLLQQQHQDQNRQETTSTLPQRQSVQQQQEFSAGSSHQHAASEAARQQHHGQVQEQLSQPAMQQQKQHYGRSPHRRSFDLPVSNTGVLGARRHHVRMMMSQAQGINMASLAHSQQQQQQQQMRPTGSGRGSLDRASSTLDVAISLAGALPGCVSEKLAQYLQAYGASSNKVEGGSDSGGCTTAAHLQVTHSQSGRGDDAGMAAAGGGYAARKSLSLSRPKSTAGSNEVLSADVQSVSLNSTQTCAVCMDQECAVALMGCSHSLCFTCTGCIVGQGLGVRPPLCPFCRTAIKGLQLVALHAME